MLRVLALLVCLFSSTTALADTTTLADLVKNDGTLSSQYLTFSNFSVRLVEPDLTYNDVQVTADRYDLIFSPLVIFDEGRWCPARHPRP